MGAPDREQVAHRAAADVEEVLGEDDLLQGTAQLVQAKQREVLGDAVAVGEAGVEGGDLRGRVAGGGG